MAEDSEPLIASVKVEQLFGLYSYTLPSEGVLPNAAILYGDNGLGKTTILRLVFHLLSPANNRGHRHALFRVPFNRLEVELANGMVVSASRAKADLSGTLSLDVKEGRDRLAHWEFAPDTRNRPDTIETAQYSLGWETSNPPSIRRPQRRRHSGDDTAYLAALDSKAPVLFMLNADRRLESDAVADPSDELELRRVMMYEEPRRITDMMTRAREIALSQALGAATRFISTKALQSANRGSTDVHSVYVDVIHHLSSVTKASDTPAAQADQLLARLVEVERKTAELADYELATPLPTEKLTDALTGTPENKTLAVSLLAPYVQSLEKRLEATEPIYRMVHRLVIAVNGFLRDKELEFRLGHGFVIKNRLDQELKPPQLSSGEQQLLLLFCYIITARDKPSVFIIDEPELSLNVKWQRQLVQTLLDIAAESSTQFLFASHSLELLAQHRERVVPLVNAQ